MENWELSLDKWLTNPPEGRESHLFCDGRCKEPFYPEDRIYRLDGLNLCEECVQDWLSEHEECVTEEDCYGEK